MVNSLTGTSKNEDVKIFTLTGLVRYLFDVQIVIIGYRAAIFGGKPNDIGLDSTRN